MIELISESRCTKCNKCVDVCPTNVFDSVEGGVPVAARISDCETCFLCEAYCPADALYVAPEAIERVAVNEQELVEKGLLGSYRRNLGWSKERGVQDVLSQLLELRAKVEPPY